MTKDIIPCGYCKEEFTREEVHGWCKDWHCYICGDCVEGSQEGAAILARSKVVHWHKASRGLATFKAHPQRFKTDE